MWPSTVTTATSVSLDAALISFQCVFAPHFNGACIFSFHFLCHFNSDCIKTQLKDFHHNGFWGSFQTCRSKQFRPLWRHVHRAGKSCCPAWASPNPPEDPPRTRNTPEGEGDDSAWALPLPEGWTPLDRRSEAPALSGSRAALLCRLLPPAIPVRQNRSAWHASSSTF